MVTTALGANDPEVGTRVREDDEEYVFVYNTGNSEIGKNYGVTLSAVTGYSVTVSTTAGTDVAVGVCKHATIPTAAYGWVLTKGFSEFKATANSAVTVGDRLAVGADGTWSAVSTISNVSGTYLPIYGKVVTANTASGGTGTAFFSIF
jgi:hypothetical protein